MKNTSTDRSAQTFSRVLRRCADLVAALTTLAESYDVANREAPAAQPPMFTSAKGGPHPTSKSARWCRTWFPKMPGAMRVGRHWTISPEAFYAFAASQTPRVKPTLAVVGAPHYSLDDEIEARFRSQKTGTR
jgi:hypothetical protein